MNLKYLTPHQNRELEKEIIKATNRISDILYGYEENGEIDEVFKVFLTFFMVHV